MHIALLGGSFNPPHVGHVLAAHYVHATRAVDEVWLMPAFVHPFGKDLAPFEHRVAMCELLCQDASGWLKTSRVEAQVGRDGRTVDTLEYLTRRAPEDRFSLVIGSDILKDLPSWRNFPRIEKLAQVLVVQRAGFPSPRAVGPALPEVSSSEVRRRLAAGDSPGELVPRSVLAYIAQHGLYQS